MFMRRFWVASALVVASVTAVGAQANRAESVGAQALRDGDADRAAAVFAEGLRQFPANPNLHFGAGVAAHMRGRDDEARASLQKALELEPQFLGAAALYGELVYQAGDVDLAIQTYERALAYAPTNENLAARLAVWRAEASKERRLDGRFSIAFDGPAEARLAAHATQTLQASYWRLGKSLGAYPSDQISVVFYTREAFEAATGAPEWADGAFDTRIRMPVRGALAAGAEFDRVLTHELAHAMIAGLAPRGIPAWLHEGLATYLEPGDVRGAVARLQRAQPVPLADLKDGFGGLTAEQALVAYDESLVAASVVAERLGPNLALLLESLGRGQDMVSALGQFGVTVGDLERTMTSRFRAAR
jgi:tetratricopeptide (TPR) repeat protein